MNAALVFGVAIGLIAALAGCGAGPVQPRMMDGGTDWFSPETHAYVIGMIDTETDDIHHAYGFDLDMANGNPTSAWSGGCQDVPDFISPVTGATGVDNQFAGLAPTLDGLIDGDVPGDGLDGAIRDQIEAGRLLLMLEVSDINSYVNDPMIGVHAVLGTVSPAGVACAAHTDMASCASDIANMCSFTPTSLGTGGACSTASTPVASSSCAARADQASCSLDQANACNWSATASACSGIAAGQTFLILSDLGTVDGSITNARLGHRRVATAAVRRSKARHYPHAPRRSARRADHGDRHLER